MISLSNTINNRNIIYIDIKDSLKEIEEVSLKDWVLLVIEDDIKNSVLEKFADLCIDKDVLYVCATGEACSEIDDLFDNKMVDRELGGGKMPSWYQSDDDVLMTTWHYDLEECFWFVTWLANYEDYTIQTVVVVNLTAYNYLPVIENLTKKK